MRWVMHNSNHFTREEKGYVANVRLGGFYPRWEIFKDGILIDDARYHNPISSDCNKELAAKAQVEKILKELP